MLDRTFNAVFDGLNEQYKPELEAVRVQYPFQDLRYRCPCLRFKYAEAMALLREQGPPKLRARLEGMTDEGAKKKLEARIDSVANHADTEDIGTEDEKLLGEIVAEVHGQDFYIIDKFPSNVRPFYTMPDPVDPNFSNSYVLGRASNTQRPATHPPHASSSPHFRPLYRYDIFIRGEEVTSGAQRIHDPQMLLDQAAAKDPPVDLSPIMAYVDSFKYGAFPHGGGGIGLERVVMLFCGLPNIRKTSLFPRDPKRLSP